MLGQPDSLASCVFRRKPPAVRAKRRWGELSFPKWMASFKQEPRLRCNFHRTMPLLAFSLSGPDVCRLLFLPGSTHISLKPANLGRVFSNPTNPGSDWAVLRPLTLTVNGKKRLRWTSPARPTVVTGRRSDGAQVTFNHGWSRGPSGAISPQPQTGAAALMGGLC